MMLLISRVVRFFIIRNEWTAKRKKMEMAKATERIAAINHVKSFYNS